MRDLKNNVDAVKSINPAVYNSNPPLAGVDIRGYDSAMAVIQSGALTDGTHTPKMQESDDNATYSDVDASDLEGSFSNITANAVQRVGYKGAKRYIRVFVASSGGTGALYGASIVRGVPHQSPVA
jgi:GT2 family glycosyltransferase